MTRDVVRKVNAHYSLKIEGLETSLENIDAALGGRYSDEPDTARRQRMAVAYIKTEQELPQLVEQESSPLRSSLLAAVHRGVFSHVTEGDRKTEDGRLVEPGQLRQHDVLVGRHRPPTHSSVPNFLARMDQVYPLAQGLDNLLLTVAAAHHRACWVHPFEDGNGRAIRLQTDAALRVLSGGLWSPSRGFGLDKDTYFGTLANADKPRRGDLDGRGNLSEQALFEWCLHFIHICAEQVGLMARLLDHEGLKDRIAQLVVVRGYSNENYRREAIAALQHVAFVGLTSVHALKQMMSPAESEAGNILDQLIQDGLLTTTNEEQVVTFGFPLTALPMLLPTLPAP